MVRSMENVEKKGMAESLYRQGTESFSKGKYQETIEALTNCLSIEKTEDYEYLESEAYNTLGMLFFFAGYETIALDYYLSALESGRRQYNTGGVVSAFLNIGLLYQAGKEYSRAMSYYQQAKEAAEQDLRSSAVLLVLYADIQIAQLYCRMGQYKEAKHLYKEIGNFTKVVADGEFLLTKCILDILLAEHEADYQRVHLLTEEIMNHLREDEQFVEQIDFYVDVCEMMFTFGSVKETRIILDLIREKIKDTDFLRLKIRIEQIEVNYQKEYGRERDYREACKRYIKLHAQYEALMIEFRRKNLKNVAGMQKLEEQKREFERRSMHDLATGLLNKKAFCHKVEQALMEHSGDTMHAMIFLDIDNFKQVNDSFGHLLGDEVIRALSDKLQEHFAEKCICGRFGGDEFNVFIGEVEDMLDLECQIEGFREDFSELGFGKEGELYVTLSIGVSYNTGMRVSYQAMLACADEALEKAKEYGKNRVSYYEIKRGIYNYA